MSRHVLSAARGRGHHRGRGGGRRVLLLRAGTLASHAVVQRCLQPALAGLGGDGHQISAGGLQHQREQRSHHAAGVRPPKAAHHLLPEGAFKTPTVGEDMFVLRQCASELHALGFQIIVCG